MSGLVSGRRRPREAELEIGRALPGAVLWLLAAGLVAAMLATAWSAVGQVTGWGVVLFVLVGAVAAMWPPVSLVALVLVGGAVLVGGPPPAATTLALVLLVHLATWVCALVARVAWTARVEVAVLVDGLRDVAVVQVPAQVLAVVALVLAGADLDGGDVWRVAGLVAGAAVVVLVLPRPDAE